MPDNYWPTLKPMKSAKVLIQLHIKSTMHLKPQTLIEECPYLSVRTRNILRRSEMKTVQDILDFGLYRIESIHQAGPKSAAEVQALLRVYYAQQNEYYYLEEVRSILKNILARESKRHEMDQHLVPGAEDVLTEIITMLEKQLNNNPASNKQ